MANLGAEVSRIFSARDRKDEVQVRECFERALKILKEIMTMSDMKERLVEINSLSNIISDLASPNPILHISRKNISSYFIPFSLKIMGSKI